VAVRVVVLGSGGAGAPPGRAQNCVLVEAGGLRLLLDAGPGCAQRLLELGVEPYRVDAVYISHRHVDHVAGLFDISVYASSAGEKLPPILAAEEAAGEILEAARGHVVGSAAESLRLVPVQGRLELGGGAVTVETVPGRHPATSHGLIVEHRGRRVYYSADTSLTPSVEEAVAGADISLVEASLPPGLDEAAEKLGHMTVEQAVGLAAKAKPGALVVLTHLTAKSLPHALRAEKPQAAKAALVVATDHMAVTV
jgi:ribonuclease Z